MIDLPLPQNLELIVELVGQGPALKLAAGKGGQRVYIPQTLDENHWLAKLIGIEAACILARHYSGELIVIPQGPSGTLAQVQRIMRRRRSDGLARGMSANEVAAFSGYSVRHIYRSRAAERHDATRGQGDLFNPPDKDSV
jgi:hypothetical protein